MHYDEGKEYIIVRNEHHDEGNIAMMKEICIMM